MFCKCLFSSHSFIGLYSEDKSPGAVFSYLEYIVDGGSTVHLLDFCLKIFIVVNNIFFELTINAVVVGITDCNGGRKEQHTLVPNLSTVENPTKCQVSGPDGNKWSDRGNLVLNKGIQCIFSELVPQQRRFWNVIDIMINILPFHQRRHVLGSKTKTLTNPPPPRCYAND